MGAIADAFVAYAQPLLDQTDGSHEQLSKAFGIGQLCYNLALSPHDVRESTLEEMRQKLEMDDVEFAEFRRSLIDPMIRRHEEMFPFLHRRRFGDLAPSFSSARAERFGDLAPSLSSPPEETKRAAPGGRYTGTDRCEPCSCGSGEKYKFCCGAKRR